MFAHLQHEASQARKASDEGAGASGAGRRFEACGVTGRPSAACSRPCNTRHRRHARRQIKERAPVGQGEGSRPVVSRGVHPLHVREPATRDIAGMQGVRVRSRRQWGRARIRGLWRHEVSMCCKFALLQHETSQAREASDEAAGASGAGREFEACGVTGRPSAACSHACNTRHSQACEASEEGAGASGGGRGFEDRSVTRRACAAC